MKLYKRNTNASVQTWEIVKIGNGYYTITGKLNGKSVKSATTKCLGKNLGKANETTPDEQCDLEVASLIRKKLEKGYTTDILNIDESNLLKPMLAKDYADYKDKLEFPVISSPKLDGIRLNVTKDGIFSRNGKEFLSMPHITKALERIFDKYPNLVLDGEAYNHAYRHNFNEIVSIVKKVKPSVSDILKSQDFIYFYVFDCFGDIANRMNSLERKNLVKDLVNDYSTGKVVALEYRLCKSYEELDAEYSYYLSSGYEGQMVNTLDIYQHKRTNFLLKRKEFKDAEFRILDIISGKGAREGAAILVLECNNQTFQCSLTGSVDYMRDIFINRQSYLDKYATVRFQDYTPIINGSGGLPRFPTCISIRNYE